MKALLDTHVFLWWVGERTDLLSAAAQEVLATEDLYLSPVTTAEIAIKMARGRLRIDEPIGQVVSDMMRRHFLEPLPLEHRHAAALAGLPLHHRDPFDRLLIAQALAEGLAIVTGDAQFAHYGVDVVW